MEEESDESDCYNLVLSALAIARFPRKIATICILPQYIPNQRYRALTLSPQTFSPYIKGLKVDSPGLHFFRDMTPKEMQERHDAKVSNDTGYHFQNYSPTSPELLKFIKAIHDVEILEISGCETFPRLRLCNGCHDLFAKHIAITHFSRLTCLRLRSVYIIGSRLRRFVKQNSATLTDVDYAFVSLTDGSWRSILQGLLKLPSLEKLQLQRLYQRQLHTPTDHPAYKGAPTLSRSVSHPVYDGREGHTIGTNPFIQQFLKLFLENFHLQPYDRKANMANIRPQYYEVVFYRFLGVPWDHQGGMKSYKILLQYAKEARDD